ncbi:MAG: tetratricopeptide repeat protein [Deltaproteobacteria bacterium]|nr:MAG: tetratricopeptide repeat protein [Deltaproteobacteria bacterium]
MFLAAAALAVAAGCGGGQHVDRGKAQTRLDLCAELLTKREYEAAETECKKALQFDPHDHRAHNYLGLIDVLRAADMHKILEIDDCLTGVDAEGLSKKKDRHLLDARAHFEDAIAARRDYGEAYSNLGAVLLQLEEYEAAAAAFRKALENAATLQNPSLTRTNLAWVYFHLGRLPEAAAELRQALRFEPDMCLAHYRLGRVYFARKEWDKALAEFEKVAAQLRVCPIQEAHLYLMKTYVQTGLGANLPRVAQACVALAPQSCVAAECRALVP